MNWGKAKNLTILFLLMVNAFLGALVYYAGAKYSMTSAQQDAVTKFLAKNRVNLYTTVPKDFRPMAAINIRPSAYNSNDLVLAFFGSTDDVTPDFYDGQAYTRGEEWLVVDGDSFTYENLSARAGFVLSRSNAIDACNKFLSKHAKVFGKFALDRVKETNDGYTVSYSGKFRDWLVTSNSLVFYVTADGISRVVGTYNEPVGVSGVPKDIISPDEALYVFVNNMNYIYGDQDILLDSMDLVYHLAEVTADSSMMFSATPYYRFYVFSGDAQVMINAYTGGVYGSIY